MLGRQLTLLTQIELALFGGGGRGGHAPGLEPVQLAVAPRGREQLLPLKVRPHHVEGVAVEEGEKYVHEKDDGHEDRVEPRAEDVLRDVGEHQVEEDAQRVREEVLARFRLRRDPHDAEDKVYREHDGQQAAHDGEGIPQVEVVVPVLADAVD